MNTRVIGKSNWSTASFGDAVDTSPMELSAMAEHLDVCRGGRMFSLQCAAAIAHRFMASRLVTTALAATVLIGVACALT